MFSSVIGIFTALYFIPRVFALLLLCRYRLRARKLKKNSQSAEPGMDTAFDGISILTSMKGPTPHMAEGVLSYLKQDYPGPLELIVAVKEPEEPLLAEAQKLVAENPSSVETRWITSVKVSGDVNPRTLKIQKCFEQARHPWIFVTCVDTRFDKGALRRMMTLTEGRRDHFVTSFPVIDSAQNFAAKLEEVGLNVDVTQFFLSACLAPKLAIAYGGGLLFHRRLLEKSGGFAPIVPLLTDDITFAQAFAKSGGIGHLAFDSGYVRQNDHSWKSFWDRQVRWRMISRFFLPELFLLSFFSCLMPAFWVSSFLSGDSRLISMSLAVIAGEILFGFLMQMGLETPRRDWRHAWVLPLYDFVGFFASCRALRINEIIWGGQRMQLNSKGAVTRIQLEK
jgi:ceramide glucosyltransferase